MAILTPSQTLPHRSCLGSGNCGLHGGPSGANLLVVQSVVRVERFSFLQAVLNELQ